MSDLKIEAARRQLGTALALFLRDADPVSVHCLAGGGCELIEFYAEKRGAEPFTSHILKTWPNLDINMPSACVCSTAAPKASNRPASAELSSIVALQSSTSYGVALGGSTISTTRLSVM